MAVVLDSLVAVFLDKLTNVSKEEVGTLAGVKSELTALERKVRKIRCLLADAERRAFYEEAVRLWLAELRDVVYDADDVIDDCRANGEASSENPSSSSFLGKIVLQQKIGKRIKDINGRLEEIAKDKAFLQLTPTDGVRESQAARVSRQTSPVADGDIVGMAIHLQVRSLLKILTDDSNKGQPLAAITGMGGIGKTTLAQKIYSDEMIGAHFQIKIWVCVSKEFAEINLLREIIEGVGGDPGNSKSKAQLVPSLRSLVHGKKFLLVLDDVWRPDVWDDLLRSPLQSMAAGSKILITTRFETVARQLGAGHLQHVEQMSVEDGWSLLRKRSSVSGEEAEMETLKDLGVKIVERCGGLPLAIRLIGGVLRGREKSRWEWEKILKDPVWSASVFPESTDKVMEALYLSYEDLPSHLKQCFLHLSLFPEDHVFVRSYVVQHWIAEGFVKAVNGLSLELEGEGYFRELVSRSLLQPKLSMIDGVQCNMHDLLRSLAQFLAEGENFFGDVSELNTGMMKLRRLSIPRNGSATDLEMLKGKEFLRSLYLSKSQHGGVILSNAVIEKLNYLRVLDLSGAEIEELPDAMRNLGHLRYLNISETPVRELPEWIGKLKNLQFLLLKNCRNIHTIPIGITKLKSLRCLEVFDGTEVDQMPRGIRGLVHLRKLIDFTVDKEDGTLEELGPLVNLHVLGITKLERILDKEKARNATIKDKATLRFLSLECTLPMSSIVASRLLLPCSSEEVDIRRRTVAIFDELCPSPSLQVLNIIGYMGLNLPTWLWPPTPPDVSSLQNLTWMGLVDCIHISQLPPLGLLPHLKKLWVKGASIVASIGSELLCSAPLTSLAGAAATVLFPRLEWMTIIDMPNLEDWCWQTEGYVVGVTAFPCLENLYIEGCPKLRSLPHSLWHGPRRMYIIECPALKEVRNINVLWLLQLEDNQMETLPPWLGYIFNDPDSTADDDPGIFILKVKLDLLKKILRQKAGGNSALEDDWKTIEHIPRVHATATDNESATFSYMKTFSFFDTNIEIN